MNEIISHLTQKKYLVNELMHKTANSKIHKCVDLQTNTKYALKILTVTQSDTLIQRFKREISNLYRLKSKVRNIINVYDHGLIEKENHTNPWYVMEIVDGMSLGEILTQTIFQEEDVVHIIKEVLKTLIDLRKNNIIHRDIKPENIMITSDFKIKVIDFGLAKQDDNKLTIAEGYQLGTLFYQDPHTIQLDETEFRYLMDFYSLGATAYTLLSGFPPYKDNYKKPEDLNPVTFLDHMYTGKLKLKSINKTNPRVSKSLATTVQSILFFDRQIPAEEKYSEQIAQKRPTHQEVINWISNYSKILKERDKVFPSIKIKVILLFKNEILKRYQFLYSAVKIFFSKKNCKKKYLQKFLEISSKERLQNMANLVLNISLNQTELKNLDQQCSSLKSKQEFLSKVIHINQLKNGHKFKSFDHLSSYLLTLSENNFEELLTSMLVKEWEL